MVGYYDPSKTRLDHMGFGLVLQEAKENEEEKKEQPAVEEKKEEVKVEEGKKEEAKGGKKGGKDEKKKKVEKIKTREGDSVKLMQLLDEAKARALKTFSERMHQGDAEEESKDTEEQHQKQKKVQLQEDELDKAAEILGISSIKYYDLKQNRVQNYVFSFDKMLDPKGNTGVYLQYMYVRILSIMRKGGVSLIENLKLSIVRA